ncbi:3-dehydroquinate synthase II [Gracilibacillus kekensis]|uniref:3-dehydroquinate synthase II n=1 Tax=Gracilibacillus kekensis TaxID=1027249 RepID=A0A1M7KN34_9BACI|nr:3-dehydroquinate synthase II [Gracilibacillus kekensis]SHM66705.1 3-dehydroquinate synthase II [Gracilibacillus kekensis]
MESNLQEAEIIRTESIGEGSRVCLDFVDHLEPTEGILLGNTGHGYLFVLAENRTTDTYPARPFRINSGAIHHYVLKESSKTAYLAELKPGDKITVLNAKGETRQVALGRVKIEKRPLMRIVARISNMEVSVTLQEADSVHLLSANYKEKQAISLVEGDRVLVQLDQPGRHLGEKIDEEIIEY